eukprot:2539573-Pleurochrysis_carterae.AAC.1
MPVHANVPRYAHARLCLARASFGWPSFAYACARREAQRAEHTRDRKRRGRALPFGTKLLWENEWQRILISGPEWKRRSGWKQTGARNLGGESCDSVLV